MSKFKSLASTWFIFISDNCCVYYSWGLFPTQLGVARGSQVEIEIRKVCIGSYFVEILNAKPSLTTSLERLTVERNLILAGSLNRYRFFCGVELW